MHSKRVKSKFFFSIKIYFLIKYFILAMIQKEFLSKKICIVK